MCIPCAFHGSSDVRKQSILLILSQCGRNIFNKYFWEHYIFVWNLDINCCSRPCLPVRQISHKLPDTVDLDETHKELPVYLQLIQDGMHGLLSSQKWQHPSEFYWYWPKIWLGDHWELFTTPSECLSMWDNTKYHNKILVSRFYQNGYNFIICHSNVISVQNSVMKGRLVICIPWRNARLVFVCKFM